MKAWSLNESAKGYMAAWKLYTGHQEYPIPPIQHQLDPATDHSSELYVSGHVILKVIQGLENKGYIIYCDN